MAWTLPRTWVTGELVTASLMNTHVRDNLSHIVTSGLLAITTFGAHSLAAAGTGVQRLTVSNSTSGTGNYAEYLAIAGTTVLEIAALSQAFTTAGSFVQAGAVIVCDGAGGLSLNASHASGDVRVYSRNVLAMTLGASGAATFVGTIASGTILITPSAAQTGLVVNQAALGTGNVSGPHIRVGRNTSGNGAPGLLALDRADSGVSVYFWTDNTGILRTASAPPDEDGTPAVTSGTVVGDQTSWWEQKNVLRERVDAEAALFTVLDTRVHDFTFKHSGYLDPDGTPAVFTGLVGYQREDWFMKNVGPQQIPCLNEINAVGYLVLSVQALHARLTALETRPDAA